MLNVKQHKQTCHKINVLLSKSNLQFQTFGNVSQRIDSEYFTIKPSGVNLTKISWKDYPIISIKNLKKVHGNLRPSSDTPTHAEIYKMHNDIKGITHAHSKYLTIWSQSKKKIPILGTTHADYWNCAIPITKPLSKNKINKNYEQNIGISIKKLFKYKKMLEGCPGVMVVNHGGFCWGNSAKDSYLNFERLEFIAELAFKTLIINKKSKVSKHIINKHFFRKHGKKSYYGQSRNAWY